MKKALLTALFVTFAATWCLAQTDSLPASTAEPCKPAACEAPCQTGACAEPFVPKWAIGFRASSITNLPGTIIMQRKIYSKGYLSLGLEYNNNPRNYYYAEIDSPYHSMSDEKTNGWSVRLNPELLHEFYKNNLFNAFSGLSATYYYGKERTDNNREYTYYVSDTTIYISTYQTKYYSYTIAIPVGLERDIMIGKRTFSVGVESTFLSFYYYYYKREGTRKYSDSDYTEININENETPWQFSVKNPFQSGVNIKIKYCF